MHTLISASQPAVPTLQLILSILILKNPYQESNGFSFQAQLWWNLECSNVTIIEFLGSATVLPNHSSMNSSVICCNPGFNFRKNQVNIVAIVVLITIIVILVRIILILIQVKEPQLDRLNRLATNPMRFPTKLDFKQGLIARQAK